MILLVDASREAARLALEGLRVPFSNSSGESMPRVSAPAVVEDLDVVKDARARLGLGRPRAAVDEVLLQRRVEALQDGVIEAIAAAAHRDVDADRTAATSEDQRRVLAALVRMVHQ